MNNFFFIVLVILFLDFDLLVDDVEVNQLDCDINVSCESKLFIFSCKKFIKFFFNEIKQFMYICLYVYFQIYLISRENWYILFIRLIF